MTVIDEEREIITPSEVSRMEGLIKQKAIDLLKENPGLTNLEQQLMSEIDEAVFESVMQYTKNNQSKAAKVLGLARGTLRKKLQAHGLLNQKTD